MLLFFSFCNTPQLDSKFLFVALMMVVVVVMMNILIAIVSDSYSDAMRRSGPLFWRARVDLIAEYEPLLPKYHETDFEALSPTLAAAPHHHQDNEVIKLCSFFNT